MPRHDRLLLVLIIIGLLISGYLWYVKLAHATVLCIGGSSACETVQNSRYAYLFGIPVAYLGFLAYAGLLALWLVKRGDLWGLGVLAAQGFFGVALFGALFSLYLTGVELFILHAICQWCVASAVTMIAIALTASLTVQEDIQELEGA
ncbi:MAG: hypothetical protein Kow0047_30080 [Anaerolineae bacterium]